MMDSAAKAEAAAIRDVERMRHEGSTRIAELEAALTDVLNSYEDERALIAEGLATKPSVSGQTFIQRARALLAAKG